jgi:hypothetical protein
MTLSGIPIVSRAWVRNRFRRVITDDPHIRLYHTARYILAEVFGEDWINENVGPASAPGDFLKNAFANETDAAAHFMRVTTLAEMILNLQRISGYSDCASQLETVAQIESTFAELEVGKLLYLYGIPFEFNTRTFVKTEDYDLHIWCRNGREAFADTKCKLETGAPSENTILNSLKQARTQLPPRQPGIVFLKVPRAWIEDENYTAALAEIAIGFMRTTRRVVSVKFYTTSVPVDADSMGEVIAVREITTPRTDFGAGLDWNLFPNVAVDPGALMVGADWFRLA